MEGRGTIRSDRCGNFWCCGVHFPASCESQKRTRSKGLFFIPGEGWMRRKPYFDCKTFDNQGFSCTSQGCAWVCLKPAAALRDQECDRLHGAAVISGARWTEFIRLSRGREPFRPATPQFVSHFTPRNGGAACFCTSYTCLIALPSHISLASPPMARFISIRETLANHMHDKAFYLEGEGAYTLLMWSIHTLS